jgi:hypothetical protein
MIKYLVKSGVNDNDQTNPFYFHPNKAAFQSNGEIKNTLQDSNAIKKRKNKYYHDINGVI